MLINGIKYSETFVMETVLFSCGSNHFGQISGKETTPTTKCDLIRSPVILKKFSKEQKLLKFASTWSRFAICFQTENKVMTQVTGLFCERHKDDESNVEKEDVYQVYPEVEVGAVTDTDIYLRLHRQCLPSHVLQDGATQTVPVLLESDKQILTATSLAGSHQDLYLAYDDINFGKLSPMEGHADDTGGADVAMSISLQLTPLDSGLSILEISCGKDHVLMLSKHGTVYSYGLGSRGQLGHGSLDKEENPRLLEALEGLKVKSISSGGWHSAAVVESGDIYTWGWNESGQLGRLALDLHKDGRMARTDDDEAVNIQPEPKCAFDIAEDVKISSVSCGSRHSVCLTDCGHVYTTGWNGYGQLGLGHQTSMDQFTKVEAVENCCQIYASHWNSVFVCQNSA